MVLQSDLTLGLQVNEIPHAVLEAFASRRVLVHAVSLAGGQPYNTKSE